VLGSELPLGHEIGLIVVAAIFIAFALVASFVVPRYKPDFPGPNGLSTFVIASIVMFGLMVAAVNFFG
jgi:membrane associated rhomboid family serine protease